jgi:uncharacterized protein YgiB involved in biofilm formation
MFNRSTLIPTSKMRRSRYVTTLLVGAAAAALASCDNAQDADVNIYQTSEACRQDYTPEACDRGLTEAKAQHAQSAPKFANREECLAAGFDNCEAAPTTAAATQTASGGSGMFMPMLMGYMMGRTLGGGMGGVGQPMQQPRPVYADRSGFLYSGDREVSRLAPGQTLNSNAATTVRTRMSPTGELAGARTVSRGGFGSTGRGMSAGS